MYTLLTATDNKPFVLAVEHANSKNELTDYIKRHNMDTSVCTIVTEKTMPSYKYGVCTSRIVNGRLVKVNETELELFKEEFEKSYRDQVKIDIDSETESMILRGFEFDNHVFSLSKAAQLNWNRILSMFSLGLLSSKIEISTKNNDVYVLTSEQVKPFATAYHNAIESVLKHSRKQKLNIG